MPAHPEHDEKKKLGGAPGPAPQWNARCKLDARRPPHAYTFLKVKVKGPSGEIGDVDVPLTAAMLGGEVVGWHHLHAHTGGMPTPGQLELGVTIR